MGIENQDRKLGFNTLAIHQGQERDSATGALITPIYQTSTFVLDELGKNKGYQYARTHNPTRSALEECLASLEGAKYGIACASGLAAVSIVTDLLNAGDHVIVGEDVYGGVYRLFERVKKKFNIEFTYVNTADLAQIKAAIKPNTRIIWLESPTNPLLKLADLEAIGEIAKKNNLIFAVDNTFATPYFQRPLEFGADIIVHSTTKYLGGHSDVIGGAIITNRDDLYEELKFYQNAGGAVPGPFDSYLILRGLKTLALRLKEHERNAFAVANFLSQHKFVKAVYYPGLPSHPQFDLAKKQMRGFGGVVAFVVEGGLEAARALVNGTELFQLAESLGGVKSLICHPATMTHAPIPKEVREPLGIVDGLIRLSVGIEDAPDLIFDLEQALSKAQDAATVKAASTKEN
ncbi:MAG: cystathionine gamma-synthase [Candidatus Melainabacteria bacterium]|nr:cystathionine gamma-synthase [Candidatus Melainabacteria bacterium]